MTGEVSPADGFRQEVIGAVAALLAAHPDVRTVEDAAGVVIRGLEATYPRAVLTRPADVALDDIAAVLRVRTEIGAMEALLEIAQAVRLTGRTTTR